MKSDEVKARSGKILEAIAEAPWKNRSEIAFKLRISESKMDYALRSTGHLFVYERAKQVKKQIMAARNNSQQAGERV